MTESTGPDERPTEAGLACPACGCHDWRVVKTKRDDGAIIRRRECRHCGMRISTIET